jgi:PTS system nitrogen regulatory IIA component
MPAFWLRAARFMSTLARRVRNGVTGSWFMAVDDFDVERLAAYLHLDPAQVARLAERGKVPGRKVAGQWRFAPAEIHHWLESRIGLSNDAELQQMETALQRPPGRTALAEITVAGALPLDAINMHLTARTRGSVITGMCELAARTGWLWDSGKMAEAVRAREELLPTSLECGIALLHPRRPQAGILGQAFLALGHADRRIPFGGTRGAPTDLFILICAVEDRWHLRILARLSRLIADPALLDALRAAPDAASAHEVIDRYEAQLTVA